MCIECFVVPDTVVSTDKLLFSSFFQEFHQKLSSRWRVLNFPRLTNGNVVLKPLVHFSLSSISAHFQSQQLISRRDNSILGARAANLKTTLRSPFYCNQCRKSFVIWVCFSPPITWLSVTSQSDCFRNKTVILIVHWASYNRKVL